MRTYLTISNFRRATMLGLVCSIMALPRILQAQEGKLLLLVAVLPSLTLAAGAATAWGHMGGLCGVFPDRKTTMKGMAIAVIVGLPAAAVLFWTDHALMDVLIAFGDQDKLRMTFPPDLTGCLALMLWSGGFATLFFVASTMSFACRITRRVWIAIMCVVFMKGLVRCLALNAMGLDPMHADVFLDGIVMGAAGCLLYARAGFPAAMVFAMVLESRHIVRVLIG